ncbi:MAG TPA: DNA polymerase III subunit delta [Candidatus Saccharimonadales bacterium]
MIVTLTGPNDFARTHELKKLVAGFVAEHGDFALETLDGEEDSFERLQESLQSLPFLSPKKLVALRTPGANKQFAEAAAELLANIPETTDVVVVEPKLDKRLSYYKFLKKATDFREFAELDANGLAKWAGEYAKENGGSLTPNDARFLVERVAGGQQRLQNELDKLLAYDTTVSRATIELLTEATPQSTVFALLDAAFSGNAARAAELYNEQRALRVEPQAIVAMLAWQLHILALVKAAGERSADDVAREAKLNPFVVRKSLGLVRAMSLDALKAYVADLLDLDQKLKSVSIDADEATRLFLLNLAI